MKILVGKEMINRELILIDVWKGTFEHMQIKPRENCPACGGRYEFLDRTFTVKTTPLCGQSRAVQVINTGVKEIAIDKLATRLERYASNITRNNFMLSFQADDHEIIVFPDGRAIIKNTTDESQAKELYNKYVRELM
jgi:adenylyltransferase/sulfurtransferase